ncbi:hypothetical protein ACK11Z_15610, partial [Methanoculleus bourgensis]|uniref:hypothetical protein n=1 Tax=Methanoculleus bourgensis TaxID=83986 RepID=UPI003B94C8E9
MVGIGEQPLDELDCPRRVQSCQSECRDFREEAAICIDLEVYTCESGKLTERPSLIDIKGPKSVSVKELPKTQGFPGLGLERAHLLDEGGSVHEVCIDIRKDLLL